MRLLTVFVIGLFAYTTKAQGLLNGVTLRYGSMNPSLNFLANSGTTKAEDLDYQPSRRGKIFVGADYKNYGVTLSSAIPRLSEDRKKYGDGSALDFQFRYTYEEFYIESYYQQYKGYYLSNAGKVMTNPFGPEGEYPQNSDLKTQHYGVVVFKFLDPDKFHPRRAFEMIERPGAGGGSWYYSAGFNTHKMRTTESLVPATAIDNYGELENLRSTTTYTLSAGGGGGYSWVYRDSWILSGMLGLSLAGQWINAKYVSDKENTSVLGTKSHIKIGGGYSGEQFIAAVLAQADTTVTNTQKSELQFTTAEASFTLGWRF